MKFENSEPPLNVVQIAEIESTLKLDLPQNLKKLYMTTNGGSPDPYVYEDDNVDTVVADFFPIASSSGARTAVDIYHNLVVSKKIVPRHYFPFAVDGGGDYFFVDCSSENGSTYLFRGDVAEDESNLLSLNLGIADFWSKLKPE
jgi:SMI1 / KNR4 family (SUKH-1)